MRRGHVHLLFGIAAIALAAAAGYDALALRTARQVNAAIAGGSAADGELAEARLAHAIALSSAGDYEGALKAYQPIAQGKRADLREIALYNAGNLHLREALKNGPEQAIAALPLIELAKQHYRKLLRSTPEDWDARYNLERALWLAPEVEDVVADDGPPVPKERSITTMQAGPIDLP